MNRDKYNDEPKRMDSRDRFRHQHVQNPLPNRHGREESYRARAEFDSQQEPKSGRYNEKNYEPGELSYEQQYRTDGEAHNYSGWIEEQSFNEYPRYGESINSIENRQRNYTGKGPKGYKRSDERIKEDVCDILAKDRYIDASDIEVEVIDSIAVLSGTVETTSQRFAAEVAIEAVWGLKDIQNDIKVNRREFH